jgi:hypothetical protein
VRLSRAVLNLLDSANDGLRVRLSYAQCFHRPPFRLTGNSDSLSVRLSRSVVVHSIKSNCFSSNPRFSSIVSEASSRRSTS